MRLSKFSYYKNCKLHFKFYFFTPSKFCFYKPKILFKLASLSRDSWILGAFLAFVDTHWAVFEPIARGWLVLMVEDWLIGWVVAFPWAQSLLTTAGALEKASICTNSQQFKSWTSSVSFMFIVSLASITQFLFPAFFQSRYFLCDFVTSLIPFRPNTNPFRLQETDSNPFPSYPPMGSNRLTREERLEGSFHDWSRVCNHAN